MAKPVEPFERSYNVKEFCASENISVPTYGKLRDQGLGPREMRYLNCVRISHADRLAWQEKRRAPTSDEAAAIQQIIEQMRAKARKGGSASAASPKHVSVNTATRRKASATRRDRKARGAP
jgi:hypothetical protein